MTREEEETYLFYARAHSVMPLAVLVEICSAFSSPVTVRRCRVSVSKVVESFLFLMAVCSAQRLSERKRVLRVHGHSCQEGKIFSHIVWSPFPVRFRKTKTVVKDVHGRPTARELSSL